MRPSILLERVTLLDRDGLPLIARLHLAVAEGEAVLIVGRAGSGKTRLARVIAGLEAPRAGTALLDGRAVSSLSYAERQATARAVGVVFDRGGVWSNRSVGRNVTLPLEYHEPASDPQPRLQAIAQELDLGSWLASSPARVPDSVRRRMLFARALVSEPRWLLVDDPTPSLARDEAELVAAAIERRRRERAMTVVYFAHEADVAPFPVERAMSLEGGALVERGQIA